MFKFKRVEWALRKSSLPVTKDALVLDVGSGGTPYPRSDVLLDRLTGVAHRCGDSMMIDRPAVFGDAQKMPFKDKAFDFVVASHILEHMAHPENFLQELQRVGKAGYIETPSATFERFFPYDIHCLEVMTIDGVLHIHKKAQPVEDAFLGSLGFLESDAKWKKLFFERPDMFHVRFFWENEITFKVHNPVVSCEWIESINEESVAGEAKDSYLAKEGGWRKFGLSMLNRFYAIGRTRRLKNFDLMSVLCCPECRGELNALEKQLRCEPCNTAYQYDPVPDFTCKQRAPYKRE
jgi:hypothetical protein